MSDKMKACEYCGPGCLGGAAHTARSEDGAARAARRVSDEDLAFMKRGWPPESGAHRAMTALQERRAAEAAGVKPAPEDRLLRAINWAMGCAEDDAFEPPAGTPRFWWRRGLAERAGLAYDPVARRFVSPDSLRADGAAKPVPAAKDAHEALHEILAADPSLTLWSLAERLYERATTAEAIAGRALDRAERATEARDKAEGFVSPIAAGSMSRDHEA